MGELTQVNNSIGLPISSMEEIFEMGRVFSASGTFGCENEAQGLVMAMTCVSEGITPLQYQRLYHNIEGKPTMKTDAMLAQFKSRGGTYDIEQADAVAATILFHNEGKSFRHSYTMEEAERSGICFKKGGSTKKDNWHKSPADMLWARCVSKALRKFCPEVVQGIYTPEEAIDFDKPEVVDSIPPELQGVADSLDRGPVQEAEIVEELTVDLTVCPLGKSAGLQWIDMEAEDLQMALNWCRSGMSVKGSNEPAIAQEFLPYIAQALEMKTNG